MTEVLASARSSMYKVHVRTNKKALEGVQGKCRREGKKPSQKTNKTPEARIQQTKTKLGGTLGERTRQETAYGDTSKAVRRTCAKTPKLGNQTRRAISWGEDEQRKALPQARGGKLLED